MAHRIGSVLLASSVCGALLWVGTGCSTGPRPAEVMPIGETEPVLSEEDAADDPAVWVHPEAASRSRIIGTDKQRGLIVFDLEGHAIQRLDHGRMNNVDLRAGFELGGETRVIVCASNRTDQTIAVYLLDPGTGRLAGEPAGAIATGLDEVYGLCMAREPGSPHVFVFVGDKSGTLQQWRLVRRGDGRIGGELVRTIDVGSQSEGMVADDEAGRLFVAEERGVIWAYGVDPEAGSRRVKVTDATEGASLTPDVEGLTILRPGGGPSGGWLIASSQGDSTFAVLDVEPPHAMVGLFRIIGGRGIDAVSETDGIHAAGGDFGPGLERGLLVVQDDADESGRQNFKLVSWAEIANALSVSDLERDEARPQGLLHGP